jgi:hypothetical protein
MIESRLVRAQSDLSQTGVEFSGTLGIGAPDASALFFFAPASENSRRNIHY